MPEDNITHEHMKTLPYIIAVDFDGTLVEDRYPHIGEKNDLMVHAVKMAQAKGHKIILWTCRDGAWLQAAVEHCRDNLGLEFDAVNRNISECMDMFNNDTRKVYANEYWDDKSTNIMALMDSVYDEVERRIARECRSNLQ